jgi:hypothetical protein
MRAFESHTTAANRMALPNNSVTRFSTVNYPFLNLLPPPLAVISLQKITSFVLFPFSGNLSLSILLDARHILVCIDLAQHGQQKSKKVTKCQLSIHCDLLWNDICKRRWVCPIDDNVLEFQVILGFSVIKVPIHSA